MPTKRRTNVVALDSTNQLETFKINVKDANGSSSSEGNSSDNSSNSSSSSFDVKDKPSISFRQIKVDALSK